MSSEIAVLQTAVYGVGAVSIVAIVSVVSLAVYVINDQRRVNKQLANMFDRLMTFVEEKYERS